MAWLKRRHHSRQRCRGTDDHVGILQQLHAGPGHHAAQGAGKLQAVVILEPMDQQARGAVIFRHGPSALEHRRIGNGGRREQRLPEIDREGCSKPLAEGPLDKANLRPALGAQGMGLAGRGLAGDAGRGIEQAERRLPGLPPSATEAGAPSSLQGIEGLAHGSSLAEGGALCHSRPERSEGKGIHSGGTFQ